MLEVGGQLVSFVVMENGMEDSFLEVIRVDLGEFLDSIDDDEYTLENPGMLPPFYNVPRASQRHRVCRECV